MRIAKAAVAEVLSSPDWRRRIDEVTGMGLAGINALFAHLPGPPRIMHRAALCLGTAVAGLASREAEAARNILRRLMWHMNEDSGNIGWGIPEAFGEILAADEILAGQYGHILISYIVELPGPDNYCDNNVLRRSCYWAVGRLVQARPRFAARAHPRLADGLRDGDVICRGMAAWALDGVAGDTADIPALRILADAGHSELCTLFDGDDVFERSVSALARETLENIRIRFVSTR
jgi:hypothetical protein